MAVSVETEQALAAKFEVLFPHLDERQRRLVMGAEARALGHGGIRAVARAAGVAQNTVSRGVADLDAGEAPLGRTRRAGGGRKRLSDVDAGLLPALLALVEPDERGDPMSPLRWTTKSTRTLAAALTAQGHRAGADTIADLLRQEGFSLQANTKTIEGKQHPDRDGQFRYLNEQVKAHQATADPVVSVDTKKKELVGQFTNAGRQWRPKGEPMPTRTHDFPDSGLGKAVPYGVYDLTADTGWVNVGTDHDTAAFAVESIRRWWHTAGQADYPHATRLLITADAGGSNGYRTRAFKAELAALAIQTGLAITVCHFPPGTSKWNKIEHRLFAHITMNWRGRPLASHEVILQSIAATTTRTGLRVHAALDTNTYPTGMRISDRQHDALPVTRHDWHGDWNYTLRPEQYPHINADPTTGPNPFDQPSPDLAWLCHPALTGLPAPQWNTLIGTLLSLHDQQREASLYSRRGRTRLVAPGAGRRPTLTLADRLLATVLHQRLELPQTVIAALFNVNPHTISRHIRDIHQTLTTTGHTTKPAEQHATTLNELYNLATREGITIPPNAKPAC
jgi:hypothetical protein